MNSGKILANLGNANLLLTPEAETDQLFEPAIKMRAGDTRKDYVSLIILENTGLSNTVQKQRQHIEKLLHEISVAQQKERKRVAMQLHDGVAQWLVATYYDIKVCSSFIAESKLTELESELAKIGKTLQKSVRELRRAIVNLRPLPLEEVGLVAAIQQATEVLNEDGIRCHAEVSGELPELTPDEENTTYWIVQEILTNVRWHSQASDVSLRIQSSDNTVAIEVSDNGRGFDTNEEMNSPMLLKHMGLIGIKERAELLGGDLNINSRPGQGTTICFSFPASSVVTMKTKA